MVAVVGSFRWISVEQRDVPAACVSLEEEMKRTTTTIIVPVVGSPSEKVNDAERRGTPCRCPLRTRVKEGYDDEEKAKQDQQGPKTLRKTFSVS